MVGGTDLSSPCINTVAAESSTYVIAILVVCLKKQSKWNETSRDIPTSGRSIPLYVFE